MRSLSQASADAFANLRFVLTDMDETLTFEGRLQARTYEAMERLQTAGVRVIPVTAAPAGWCDQMARMWPVDGVIGENGGLFFQREPGGHAVHRRFWCDDAQRDVAAKRLEEIRESILSTLGFAALADDQPFRLTSLAFNDPHDPDRRAALVDGLRARSACVTANNLWILAWIGDYDKLTMARRILASVYGMDIDAERDAVLYCGD